MPRCRVSALHEDLTSVDGRLATVERTLKDLGEDVSAIHETVEGVQGDIQRVTGLRGERGVMERTRDLLTGGHPSKTQGEPVEPEEPEKS